MLRFALVLLFFIFLITISTGTVSSEAIISVSPQEPAAGGDENFTVNIYIEPDESVAGVQFDFVFDSSLVSIENVREGNLLKQPGSDTIFSPGDVDNSPGIVIGVHGFILGKSAATAPGTFAAIDLASTGGSGICELQLSNVIISDSSGHAVPVRVVNRTVRIGNDLALSPNQPSGKAQSENELTEGVLTGENSEDNQEDQNNQPAFLSIFSDIRNFFRDQFNIK